MRGGGGCFSPASGDHRSASAALLPLTFIRRSSIAAKASPSPSCPSTLELRSKEKCSDPLPHAGVVVRVGGAFRDSDRGLTLWPVVTSVCHPPRPPPPLIGGEISKARPIESGKRANLSSRSSGKMHKLGDNSQFSQGCCVMKVLCKLLKLDLSGSQGPMFSLHAFIKSTTVWAEGAAAPRTPDRLSVLS